jgi:HEPN domain-containing protein
MPNRSSDWMTQARADLDMARNASKSGNFEWSCFAAQQAAEKAVKSVALARGIESWGHSVSGLLRELRDDLGADESLIDLAKELDRHYIPARYPNGLPSGAPTEYYTLREAERAIDHAATIIEWCADLPG